MYATFCQGDLYFSRQVKSMDNLHGSFDRLLHTRQRILGYTSVCRQHGPHGSDILGHSAHGTRTQVHLARRKQKPEIGFAGWDESSPNQTNRQVGKPFCSRMSGARPPRRMQISRPARGRDGSKSVAGTQEMRRAYCAHSQTTKRCQIL